MDTPTGGQITVMIPRRQIAGRVAQIGAQITTDFPGQKILLLGVLKGACIFLSDLARAIDLDVSFDFISVSSYGAAKQSSGEVKLVKGADIALTGKNVIIVEDILDTGLTLTYLRKVLLAAEPASLKIAALLDKPCRRRLPLVPDYFGFEIPDEFVVGYGMDYAEQYRNLPDICVLRDFATST